MDKSDILFEVKEFTRKKMQLNDVAHDFLHVLRVVKMTKYLVKIENNCDPFLAEMVAWLHDICDHKLSSSENDLFLFLNSLPLNKYQINDVISLSKSISFSQVPVLSVDAAIEAKIVQDADRLDALGAIGIARTFAYSGAKQIPFYSDMNSLTTFNHFEEKLLHLSDFMNTKEGKRIARKRQQFLNIFYRKILFEITEGENFDE